MKHWTDQVIPLVFFHPLLILLSQFLSSILRQYDSQALLRKKSALIFSLLCNTDKCSNVSCTLCSQYVNSTISCSHCCWRPSSAPPASPKARDAYSFFFTLSDDQHEGMVPQRAPSTLVLIATFFTAVSSTLWQYFSQPVWLEMYAPSCSLSGTSRRSASSSSPVCRRSAIPGGCASHSSPSPSFLATIGVARTAGAPLPSAASAACTAWGHHWSSRQVPKGQGIALLEVGFDAIVARRSVDHKMSLNGRIQQLTISSKHPNETQQLFCLLRNVQTV